MEFKEVLQFVESEDEFLTKYYNIYDIDKKILARNVKISEEVGELSAEVLKYLSLQMRKKMDSYNPKILSEEFADVILTTMLLAKSMNVDIMNSLKKKISKIQDRQKSVLNNI
jgi:NTP pyrophosphatase (non-canonical NTP hydrolase)